jgi:hypothetical protein
MIITEPRWKSLIVETTTPLFTPEQCQMIIDAGQKQPREDGQVGGGKGGHGRYENKTITHILDSFSTYYLKCIKH